MSQRFYNLALIFVMFAIVVWRVFGHATVVQPDSPRYMVMGLNFAQHGVLSAEAYNPSVAPKPGFTFGGPFTAFELGFAVRLDDNTKQGFLCVVNAKDYRNCEMKIPGLQILYVLEIFIFHLSVWLIARHVFKSDIRAWLAAALAFGFKETGIYAHSILTEPGYLMSIGVFFVLWVKAFSDETNLKRWFWCGLALGMVAMVKPAWSALLPGLAGLGIVYVLWQRSTLKPMLSRGGAFAAGVAVVSSLMLVRNVIQLDFWGLSDPTYLALSFAHRFAFNAMSWTEWFASWIHYLPNFGDNLARSLFGADVVHRLDWGPESYYAYGYNVLYGQAVSATSEKEAGAYLLKHHFFNDTLKSIAVTAALAWRGIFVGGWFGLVAVIFAVPVFIYSTKTIRHYLAMLLIPALLMAGVHALVSVSLTRYNIPLIVPYSLILAQVFYALGCKVSRLIPSGLMATAKTFLPKNG